MDEAERRLTPEELRGLMAELKKLNAIRLAFFADMPLHRFLDMVKAVAEEELGTGGHA